MTYTDSEFLFVYGTLRSETEHPMSRLLQKYSANRGAASFKGKLFDAGSYPAAIASDNEADKVQGELLELKKPGLIFNNLDKYEGYNPQRPNASLFVRKEMTVNKKGKLKTSWIYLYNRTVDGLTRIPEGDYLEYLRSGKNQIK